MKTQKSGEIIGMKLKRPTVNDIEFPNMRVRNISNEAKQKKKAKNEVEKQSQQFSCDFNQLKRTYSINVLTHRKDLKLMFSSPKRKFLNHQIMFTSAKNRLDNNFLHLQGQSPKQKCNFQQKVQNHKRRFTLLDLKLNAKKDFKQSQSSQNEKIFLQTMFPGIRLSKNDLIDQQYNYLRSSPSGSSENQNFSEQASPLRQSKKKPLFNGKLISIKKRKQEYPQQLVMRKLVWDGREGKKVDHQHIYKEMIAKIRPQKTQQIQYFQQPQKSKKGDQMLLTAWQDSDFKRLTIQTRQR